VTFDAGAIEATLTLKRDQFQRDIAAMEAQYEALRRRLTQEITVKIRTEAQDKVNEAINSGRLGLVGSDPALLKKLEQEAAQPGGIGILGTGTDTTLNRLLRQQLEKAAQTGGVTAQLGTGQSGNETSKLTQDVTQQLVGPGVTAPGTVTQDVEQKVIGEEGGNIKPETITDVAKVKEDDASAKSAGATAGESFKKAFTLHLDGIFTHFGGGGGDGGASEAGKEEGGFFSNSFVQTVAGSKFQVITAGLGAIFAALPAFGALAGVGIGVALIGGIAGELLSQDSKVKKAASSMGTDVLGTLEKTIQPLVPVVLQVFKQIETLMRSIAPELTDVFKTVAPQIIPIFQAIIPVVHDLVNLMAAAAPAVEPFIKGLLSLVGNVLTPLIAGVKDVLPFLSQFGATLGVVGKNLGGLFDSAGPAIKASIIVLDDLLGIITGLIPVIGKLGDYIAVLLAPVMTALGKIIEALEPILFEVGQLFATLAQAVLGNLVGGFGAIVDILKLVAPAFENLVKAINQAFTLMENRGVFNDLEDAIEQLAPPLGRLISLLINGIAPFLPIVIGALAKLADTLQGVLVQAIMAVLPALTKLATSVLQSLTVILPVVLPLVEKLVQILAGAAGGAIVGLADALGAIINALPPSVLDALVIGIGGIVAGMKAWALVAPLVEGAMALLNFETIASTVSDIAQTVALKAMYLWDGLVAVATRAWAVAQAILDAAMDINPFVAITVAVIALTAIIIKYHTQIYNFIVKTWNSVENFVKTVWGGIENVAKSIWNAITGFFTTMLNAQLAIFKTTWNAIESSAKTIWNAIYGFFRTVWTDIYGFFSSSVHEQEELLEDAWNSIYNTIRNVWGEITDFFDRFWGDLKTGFDNAVGAVEQAWDRLENIFETPVNFLIKTVYDNGIARLWNDVMGAIGGPKLPVIAGLAHGGKINAGTGPTADDVLIRASKGETVLSARDSAFLAPVLAAMGVPGYAAGGAIPPPQKYTGASGGSGGGIIGALGDIFGTTGKLIAAVLTGNTTAFTNALSGVIGTSASGELGTMMVGIPKTIIKTLASNVGKIVSSVIGGAGGAGSATIKQIEAWWIEAGGPPAVARIAAAITGAESGFNPKAVQQGQPYATTGWGLWQITPGDSEPQFGINQQLLTGFTNAEAAVAKYRGAGGFSPWTTYEDGAYLKFMDRGGILGPGVHLIANATGQNERVLTPAQSQSWDALSGKALLQKLDTLIAATQRAPRRTASGVSDALSGVARGAAYRALNSTRG
jgi:phage-related protein